MMDKLGSLKESRAKRDQALKELLENTAQLTKTLSSLDESQRTAVVGLVAVTKTVTAYQRSRNQPNEGLARQFDDLVERLAPVPARNLGLNTLFRGCLDESIAYAAAMSRCLQEGKTETECDRENASEAAAEVACLMKQLEALIKGLKEILRGPRPGPQPRPI